MVLSGVRSHVVQKNIRRKSSATRLLSHGLSSWLQLWGLFLWPPGYAGMFPRTSLSFKLAVYMVTVYSVSCHLLMCLLVIVTVRDISLEPF